MKKMSHAQHHLDWFICNNSRIEQTEKPTCNDKLVVAVVVLVGRGIL